jgi:hypothetical protein
MMILDVDMLCSRPKLVVGGQFNGTAVVFENLTANGWYSCPYVKFSAIISWRSPITGMISPVAELRLMYSDSVEERAIIV